ncbi:MAG TPA: PA14 domain-containing protein [Polyangia bacterium]|nr:PA14 domain-containing protein [Polyangia bacterium]
MATVDVAADNAAALTIVGGLCARSADCASGFCVEGVCCSSACQGPCLTCAAPGNVGQCQPAEVGSDPRNDCPDDGILSCGRDGFCDGAGGCRRYPAGAVCREATCSASSLTTAALCDGAGKCVIAAQQSCSPFLCGDNAACKTTCASDADCLTPASCQGGTCGRKPPGSACGSAGQCASNICAQGVCCATACDGVCRSCALASARGSCTNIPASQQALGTCAAPSICSSGDCGGLRAEYFRAVDMTSSAFVRTDPNVDFDWGQSSPDPAIAIDNWSVRWTGTVTARYSETYTFFTRSDDGVRLFIAGQSVIDDWTEHSALDRSGTIALKAGQPVGIRLEFFDAGGAALVSLSWSSASEPKAIVPTSQLRP